MVAKLYSQIKKDGRAGRDADGDGLLDERGTGSSASSAKITSVSRSIARGKKGTTKISAVIDNMINDGQDDIKDYVREFKKPENFKTLQRLIPGLKTKDVPRVARSVKRQISRVMTENYDPGSNRGSTVGQSII